MPYKNNIFIYWNYIFYGFKIWEDRILKLSRHDDDLKIPKALYCLLVKKRGWLAVPNFFSKLWYFCHTKPDRSRLAKKIKPCNSKGADNLKYLKSSFENLWRNMFVKTWQECMCSSCLVMEIGEAIVNIYARLAIPQLLTH